MAPTVSELSSKERWLPDSTEVFLTQLLKSDVHDDTGDRLSRLITSLGADFVHAISRGRVITDKHFLIALGLHNLTGQGKVIDVLIRLGHCMLYNKVRDIETAQAQNAQVLANNSAHHLLKPSFF